MEKTYRRQVDEVIDVEPELLQRWQRANRLRLQQKDVLSQNYCNLGLSQQPSTPSGKHLTNQPTAAVNTGKHLTNQPTAACTYTRRPTTPSVGIVAASKVVKGRFRKAGLWRGRKWGGVMK